MGHRLAIQERVPHTCPAIDAAIASVKAAYALADKGWKYEDAEALGERLSSIEWELRSVVDDLNKLRNANDELREMAADAMYRCDELTAELDGKLPVPPSAGEKP